MKPISFLSALTCSLLLGIVGSGSDAGQSERDLSLDQVEEMIARGDETIIPTLRVWLGRETDQIPEKINRARLYLALDGLAAFGDSDSLPALIALYEDRTADPSARNLAAGGIAALASNDDVELLRRIMWDQDLRLTARCRAAAALVRFDDEHSRDFLLLHYDMYRLERKARHHWSMDPVRQEVELLGDAKLMSALEERLPHETHQTMRNNIRTLLVRMRINTLSVAELKEIAADPAWSNAYQRYPAIETLGRSGDPELIPFLESLGPWTSVGTGAVQAQQEMLRRAKFEAIDRIRRHSWRMRAADEPKSPPVSDMHE